MIQQSTLDFLSALKANNKREWFQDNKAVYEKAHQNTITFADSLLEKMRIHDNIETASGKASLFRIYADTRFSKDKAPYKTHFGIRFSRATAQLRGGYYFHLEPGNSFMAGGFFSPNPDDLKRIREDIAFNYEDWNELLTQSQLTATFGELRGEGVKTAPKGFDKDHPAIDLLRKKQFILSRNFTDKEVLQSNFVEKLDQTFRELRPFFDYMSEVLTTDSNGESIL
ncbi:MAG: DUF2461 domain-containing protein [Fluviicola sp.]